MEKVKIITGWISIIAIVLIALFTLVFRFMNTELTETQIFLKIGWVFIPMFAFVGINIWSFK